MPSQQQLKTIEKYVSVIHELLVDQYNGRLKSPNRAIQNHRPILVRMLGQLLYEAPKIHTGMVSVRLLEQKLQDFKTKPCLEHHHSRQRGGDALVRLVERSVATKTPPTEQQVMDILLVYCQVHYTTTQENATLRKHQRRCMSEAAYRRARIDLVHAPELFAKKGRHTAAWKAAMIEKYQPVLDEYNAPKRQTTPIPHSIRVIN